MIERGRRRSIQASRNVQWWAVALSGVILVIWGLVALFSPLTALLSLAVYLGITLLVTGLLLIASAIMDRRFDETWGLTLGMGLIDGIIGFLLLLNPVVTAAAIPLAVGLWAMFRGVLQIVDSFRLRSSGERNWWAWLAGGVLSGILGWILLSAPAIGALVLTVWAGLAAIVVGALAIGLGLQMRSRRRPPLRVVDSGDRGRRAG